MEQREKFLEELAIFLDYWIKQSANSVADESVELNWTDHPESFRIMQKVVSGSAIKTADIENIFSECLRGFAVSFLTIIDGGTALAEDIRLRIVDSMGKSLGEGLHELFVSHLLETDRIR